MHKVYYVYILYIYTYECVFLVNNGSHRTGFPATSVRRENNNDSEKK